MSLKGARATAARRRARPHTSLTAAQHLEQQPRAVLDAAAVVVGALVGAVRQELVEQIAVGAVHLDAVEAGGRRFSAARRNSARCPGISPAASARGAGIGFRPSAVKVCTPRGAIAEGATGGLAVAESGCEMRPTCHSCTKISRRPRCTASVTRFQPATCASLWTPGVAT
jgi:hypothetical protein